MATLAYLTRGGEMEREPSFDSGPGFSESFSDSLIGGGSEERRLIDYRSRNLRPSHVTDIVLGDEKVGVSF